MTTSKVYRSRALKTAVISNFLTAALMLFKAYVVHCIIVHQAIRCGFKIAKHHLQMKNIALHSIMVLLRAGFMTSSEMFWGLALKPAMRRWSRGGGNQ